MQMRLIKQKHVVNHKANRGRSHGYMPPITSQCGLTFAQICMWTTCVYRTINRQEIAAELMSQMCRIVGNAFLPDLSDSIWWATVVGNTFSELSKVLVFIMGRCCPVLSLHTVRFGKRLSNSIKLKRVSVRVSCEIIILKELLRGSASAIQLPPPERTPCMPCKTLQSALSSMDISEFWTPSMPCTTPKLRKFWGNQTRWSRFKKKTNRRRWKGK